MVLKLTKKFIANYIGISVYASIGLLNNVVLLVSSVFIMNKISVDEYGKIVYYTLILSIITPLPSVISTGFYWKNFFKTKGSQSIFSTIYVAKFLILVFILLGLLMFDFNQFLKTNFHSYLLIIPIVILSNDIKDDILTLFIYKKQIKNYAIVSISLTFIEPLCFFLLLVFYKNSYEAKIVSFIILSVLNFALFVYYFAYKEQLLKRITFIWKDVKEVLSYSYPLVVQMYSKLAMGILDRWFLVTLISTTSLAVYSFGYQIGSMVSIFITAILNYFWPVFYKSLEENNFVVFKKNVKKFQLFLICCTAIIFGIFIVFYYVSPLLYPIIYRKSSIYILFSGISSIIFSYVAPYMSILAYYDRTKIIGIIGLLTLLVSFTVSYVLINQFSEIGAAWSTIIVHLFYAFLIYFYGKKFLKMNISIYNNIES